MEASGQAATPNAQLRSQWTNPSDILSLLLLVGGDVIQKALGQRAGHRFTPVAFSFGWVSYAFSVLLSAVGEKKIMPEPDCPAIVVNTSSGYSRTNRSWIIGRMVRDVEHWMNPEARDDLVKMLENAQKIENAKVAETNNKRAPQKPAQRPQRIIKRGLCVSICRSAPDPKPYRPRSDLMCYISPLVTILQLGIAAIPCGLYGEWQILVVTACGTLLAFLTGILPQWSEEKWACRILDERSANKTVALTRGNGAQHVIIIIGNEGGYDLEDLAASEAVPEHLTTVWIFGILLLWTALLITVSGIKANTWYLVAVGALGTLQNIYIAGTPRAPDALGVRLEYLGHCVRRKAMGALMEAEIRCAAQYQKPGVAKSLIPVFLDGEIWPSERDWWALPLELKTSLFRQGFWEKKKAEQLEMIARVKAQSSNQSEFASSRP